jgi:hypothetical protein
MKKFPHFKKIIKIMDKLFDKIDLLTVIYIYITVNKLSKMKQVYLILLISLFYPQIIKCSTVWQNDYLIHGDTSIYYPEQNNQEYYFKYGSNTYHMGMICTCVLLIIPVILFRMIHYLCQTDFEKFMEENNIKVQKTSFTAKINTNINLQNIFDHVVLSDKNIVAITLIRTKIPDDNITKPHKYFLNYLKMEWVQDNKNINFTLFRNGTIKCSECKNYQQFLYIFNHLIIILKNGVHTDTKNIDFIDCCRKINVIKSNFFYCYHFKVDYAINCDNLKNILLSNKYENKILLANINNLFNKKSCKIFLIGDIKVSIMAKENGNIFIYVHEPLLNNNEYIINEYIYFCKILEENHGNIILGQ